MKYNPRFIHYAAGWNGIFSKKMYEIIDTHLARTIRKEWNVHEKSLKKHEKAKKFPEKSYRKSPEDVFDSENVVEVLN